ncbi:MAG: hypothetical protein NTY41_17480 [Proteobacteria bacterium]|nr:hypothetical protein [Pseudomonadota bacterium]
MSSSTRSGNSRRRLHRIVDHSHRQPGLLQHCRKKVGHGDRIIDDQDAILDGLQGRGQRIQLVDQSAQIDRLAQIRDGAGTDRLQPQLELIVLRHEYDGLRRGALILDFLHGPYPAQVIAGEVDRAQHRHVGIGPHGLAKIRQGVKYMDVIAEVPELNSQQLCNLVIIFNHKNTLATT